MAYIVTRNEIAGTPVVGDLVIVKPFRYVGILTKIHDRIWGKNYQVTITEPHVLMDINEKDDFGIEQLTKTSTLIVVEKLNDNSITIIGELTDDSQQYIKEGTVLPYQKIKEVWDSPTGQRSFFIGQCNDDYCSRKLPIVLIKGPCNHFH